MNVLVVDDDEELCELLSRALVRDDHTVVTARTCAEAKSALGREQVDLLVLDLDLPDAPGLTICRDVRATDDDLPILILTASGAVTSRIEGLDAGADDYLVKPFAVAELRARVRALGRRRDARSVRIEVGSASLDLRGRRAWRDGLEVVLTSREWAILEVLGRAEGRVVSRGDLLGQVWGETSEASSASLDVLIARIRRKLGRDVVRTVRGEGHALGR